MPELSPRIYHCVAFFATFWFTYMFIQIIHTSDTTVKPWSTRPRPFMKNYSTVKNILMWSPRSTPFDLIPLGDTGFTKNHCPISNCYITINKKYLPDIRMFDAVLFNAKALTAPVPLPPMRSPDQKYIFVGYESAHNYRVCHDMYENYFNWTWTYKLNSDIGWNYITIYDLDGRVVGPKEEMVWPELSPITDDLKKKLDRKKKAVMWLVSNCRTYSKREQFFKKIQREMKNLKYSWTIDVYGNCGTMRCLRANAEKCRQKVETDYKFYFAFENSFSEDYVTEKLLTALNYYAVPVVYGGANYSR